MARKKKETVTTPIAEPVVAPEPAPSVDAAPPFEPMIFTLGTCRACLRWIAAEEDAGPFADQHAAGCALRDDPTPFPRDDAEMADVRERCAKGPIPPPAKSPPERTATTPTPAPVVEPKPEKAPRKPRARKVKVPPVDATAAPATPDAASSSAPEPIATPTTETGAPPVVTSLVETLKKTFPELAEPEVIQGTDVAEAATWVDLSVAFSPVLPARQSLLPVEATQLDGGRYRIYAPHAYSTPGLPVVEAVDVPESDIKVMWAWYLLRRGELLSIFHALDPEQQRAVRDKFFGGTMPWMPPAGSPLADMTAPLTMKREEGKPIDWNALMTTLTTPGAKPPEVAPVVKPTLPAAALGAPLAPKPKFKPPKAHRIEGPHDKRCGRWKVHDLKRLDPKKLPEELKLCDECWGAWEAEQAKPDFGHNAHGDRYDLGTGRCF